MRITISLFSLLSILVIWGGHAGRSHGLAFSDFYIMSVVECREDVEAGCSRVAPVEIGVVAVQSGRDINHSLSMRILPNSEQRNNPHASGDMPFRGHIMHHLNGLRDHGGVLSYQVIDSGNQTLYFQNPFASQSEYLCFAFPVDRLSTEGKTLFLSDLHNAHVNSQIDLIMPLPAMVVGGRGVDQISVSWRLPWLKVESFCVEETGNIFQNAWLQTLDEELNNDIPSISNPQSEGWARDYSGQFVSIEYQADEDKVYWGHIIFHGYSSDGYLDYQIIFKVPNDKKKREILTSFEKLEKGLSVMKTESTSQSRSDLPSLNSTKEEATGYRVFNGGFALSMSQPMNLLIEQSGKVRLYYQHQHQHPQQLSPF